MLTDKHIRLKDTNTGASSQFTPQSKAMSMLDMSHMLDNYGVNFIFNTIPISKLFP